MENLLVIFILLANCPFGKGNFPTLMKDELLAHLVLARNSVERKIQATFLFSNGLKTLRFTPFETGFMLVAGAYIKFKIIGHLKPEVRGAAVIHVDDLGRGSIDFLTANIFLKMMNL